MSAAAELVPTEGEVRVQTATKATTDHVYNQSSALAERVAGLVITDQSGLELASLLLGDIQGLRKEVERDLGAPKLVAHGLWKKLCEVFNKHDEPLKAAEQAVKQRIGAYHHAEQERIRIENAKAAAEANRRDDERKLAEAEALESAGEAAAAEAVLNEPAAPPPPPRQVAPKVKGVSVRTIWKAEITDMEKLIQAAAKGDRTALGILKDDKVIAAAASRANAVAKALKGELDIPGVRAYEDTSVAGRAA